MNEMEYIVIYDVPYDEKYKYIIHAQNDKEAIERLENILVEDKVIKGRWQINGCHLSMYRKDKFKIIR